MTANDSPETSETSARKRPTEKIRSRSSGQSSVRQFRLVSRDRETVDYASRGERTVIGTHPSADLVLRDPTVSRFHCEIVIEEEHVLVRDLNSRNGTIVDGVAVLAARLSDPSTLTLGRTHLRFELGADYVPLALVDGDFHFASGHVTGGSGRATFAAHLNVGDTGGSGRVEVGIDDGVPLMNPAGAEVVLAVHSRGPALTGQDLKDQISAPSRAGV